MREIIFRGKRIDNGEWAYGYVFDNGIASGRKVFVGGLAVSDNKRNTCDRYEVGVDFEEVDPSTIGQYTGLTDKNGVKVFEGDIVRCSRGCPHEVVWMQEHGGTFVGGMPTFYLSGLSDGYAWTGEEEVIGNIHDNPDLPTCHDNG